jgi:beta-lactamase class A
MKFLKIIKQHSVDRIFAILLVALVVMESFSLWLVTFPDTPTLQVFQDKENAQEISNTRQIDVSEFLRVNDKHRRLASWQAFSDSLTERLAEKEVGIKFVDLNDPDFSLEINSETEFTAASTYKLFAAYAMFNSGNPPACLDDMIIYSDNDCPLEYLASYGWTRLTQDALEIGAEQTWFDETTHSTAHDLAIMLEQIYDGSLLSEADNLRLLQDMEKQIFREGIPAGIPEARVADKVGFLDELLHDAAIVYSPKGDFVLVILSEGESWQFIADVAAEIYANF